MEESDLDLKARTVFWRAGLLVVGALVLYGLLPELVDVWSRFPQLRTVGWPALGIVVVAQ